MLYGLEVAAEVFRQAGAGELETLAAESEWRDEVPAAVARVEGPARALLAAERTALNLLGHLSGVATLTARFVRARRGHGGQDPRHPEDHPGTAGAGEGSGGRRRRDQPPDGPLRRDPDQGEPRGAGGRGRGGGAARPRGAARPAGRGRVPRPRRGPAGRRGRRGPAAPRQHEPGRAARGGGAAARRQRRPSSRPRAGSPWRRSARSPPRASTSSPSARSRTPRRRSTSA